MRETYELRVREEFADMLFGPHEGRPLDMIRLVKVPATDPRVREIARLQRELPRTKGKPFFYGWDIRREYSRRELAAAELLLLHVTSTFNLAGEEFGTKYDESVACKMCGADARQMSDLCLNVSRIPRALGLSRTIAGEIVIADSLAELLVRSGVPSSCFGVVRDYRDDKVSNAFRQLAIPEPSIDIAAKTQFGNEVFATAEDSKQYRCPLGHVLGLARLSEAYVARNSYRGEPMATSLQFKGDRRGLLRPERILFVLPQIWELLDREKVRGLRFEVARVV